MTVPDLKFVVISDVHILPFPQAGARVFDRALQSIARHAPDADLFIFNGDIVYQLDSWRDDVCRQIHEENYDIVLDLLDRHLPKENERIYVLGNHEYPQNNDDPQLTQQALAMWEAKFRQPTLEHRIVKGYHFVKFPVLSWSMPQLPEAEAQVIALLTEAMAADPTRPVFFLSHEAIHGTVDCWEPSHSFSDNFRAFLMAHPQIIHISGHHHVHLLDDRRILQDGFTSITAPCCAVGGFYMPVMSKGPRPKCSQSMVFEVRGGRTDIFGLDHTADRFVGTSLTVDLDEMRRGIFRYDRSARANAPVPCFAPGTALSADVQPDTVTVSVPQLFTESSPFPFYYDLTVSDVSGAPVFHEIFASDYYLLSDDTPRAKVFACAISTPPTGEYSITVRPMNCFFTGSSGISIAVTV